MSVPTRVRFTSVAVADVSELSAWIRKGSEAAADRFEDAVRTTANELLAFPSAGARLGFGSAAIQNSRWVRVAGFASYLLIYRFDEENVEVVRVLHGARDLDSLTDE